VLEAIARRQAAPAPRIDLRYWVLSAVRDAPDADQRTLTPLAPVLRQLDSLHGDLGFTVEDSVSLASESGTAANINGQPLSVSQEVRSDGRRLSGRIALSFAKPGWSGQQLDVTVTMDAGEFLVLGERTFKEPRREGLPEREGLLFYIVHWPAGE
jgi:hypothetical protein